MAAGELRESKNEKLPIITDGDPLFSLHGRSVSLSLFLISAGGGDGGKRGHFLWPYQVLTLFSPCTAFLSYPQQKVLRTFL